MDRAGRIRFFVGFAGEEHDGPDGNDGGVRGDDLNDENNVVSDCSDDDDFFAGGEEEHQVPEHYANPEYLLRVWQTEVRRLISTHNWRQMQLPDPAWNPWMRTGGTSQHARTNYLRQGQLWRNNMIRSCARAEVDLARVGGTFPDEETRTDFESMFDAEELEILIQERVRYGGPDFEPDDLEALNADRDTRR